MQSSVVVVVFLDLVVILMAARAMGWLMEKAGQPAVIGEIAAGVLAGPTVLGPAVSGALFPLEARSYLSLLANVGVAVFMFLAGLELDRSAFSGRRRPILAVSGAAYAVPFLLGCGLAVVVLSRHRIGDGQYFALFLGCAFAVTAFPVLARILHDRNMFHTPIGQFSLACAAVVDLLAWSALAVVLAVANPSTGEHWRWAVLIPVAMLLWCVARPALRWMASVCTDQTMIMVGVSGALLLGAVTEWVGLHLIFGAFAMGIAFPRRCRAAIESGVQVLVAVLLPAFFVVAGLAVDLRTLDATAVGELALIVAAAVLGKIGSAYAVGRVVGLDSRESAGVAALLNTRGLTELVILNVGLSVGLIGGPLYSLLVVMALVTTAMTAPLLRLVGVGATRYVGSADRRDDRGRRADADGTSARTRTT